MLDYLKLIYEFSSASFAVLLLVLIHKEIFQQEKINLKWASVIKGNLFQNIFATKILFSFELVKALPISIWLLSLKTFQDYLIHQQKNIYVKKVDCIAKPVLAFNHSCTCFVL